MWKSTNFFNKNSLLSAGELSRAMEQSKEILWHTPFPGFTAERMHNVHENVNELAEISTVWGMYVYNIHTVYAHSSSPTGFPPTQDKMYVRHLVIGLNRQE
jgi:hypothetical protein